MSRILSTLQGITNFQSGVGGGDDLLVRVREDPDGGWFAQVHNGFYYIGTEEEYLFANKGSYSFTDLTTGSVTTIAVSGQLFDPTLYGPVIMRRAGQVRILQRVCSPLRAFRPISFTGTDPLVATIPSSGLLVSLVSQPVTGILLSVPTTGDIISNEDYFYDREVGKVYIRATNPPSIFATYIVDQFDPSLLQQEEILVVDTDGRLRTQFSNVWYSPATGAVALNPSINKPTPNGLITLSGAVLSGNVITFNASGGIGVGDIVAVRYYVKDSYTAVPSGNVLVVNYLLGASGNFTLEYETGSTWYDTSLTSGTVNYIQLNPILEPRTSAFLYVVDSNEAFPPATYLTISASNLNPLFNPSGCAKVVVGVIALDAENEPIPSQPIVINVAGGSASGTLTLATAVNGSTSSASGTTNGIGQVLYNWTPQGTGLVTITASVSGFPAASGILNFIVRDTRYYDQASEQQLGKLLMNMEDAPFRNNLRRVNAYYCYRDGAPFAPSGQTTIYTTPVTFNATVSQFYTLDGLPIEKPVVVTTDQDGIASILVDPAPGDVIRAFVQTPVAGRIRTANPIFVPKTEVVT